MAAIWTDAWNKRTFRFTRDELGLLVDFMAELMKREEHRSSVCGGCRGSENGIDRGLQRLRKQAMDLCFVHPAPPDGPSQLAEDEMNPDNVFIIDESFPRSVRRTPS